MTTQDIDRDKEALRRATCSAFNDDSLQLHNLRGRSIFCSYSIEGGTDLVRKPRAGQFVTGIETVELIDHQIHVTLDAPTIAGLPCNTLVYVDPPAPKDGIPKEPARWVFANMLAPLPYYFSGRLIVHLL